MLLARDAYADRKISELTADTSPTSDDLMVTVNDPATLASDSNRKVTLGNLFKALLGSGVVTSGNILVANGTQFNSVAMSGDATITSAGVVTVTAASSNTSGWVESPTERVRLINQSGRVGIGTSTPNQQLEITRNFRMPAATATTGIIYKDGNTWLHDFGSTTNFFAGTDAGNLTLTSASENTAVGQLSGDSLTTGDGNTLLGDGAGRYLTIADTNVMIGEISGGTCANGQSNVFIGNNAGDCTGNPTYGNVAVGDNSLAVNTLGQRNVALGPSTLGSTTLAENNTAVGSGAGGGLTSGGGKNYNTFLGANAGNTGQNATVAYSTCLGTNCRVGASHSLILGDDRDTTLKVGIGTSVPREQLEITRNMLFANTASTGATSIGIVYKEDKTFLHNMGTDNLFLGKGSGNLTLSTGNSNIGIGTNALNAIDGGQFNTAIGYSSQVFKNTDRNTTVGYNTMNAIGGGSGLNVAVGSEALRDNSTGSSNVAIGDIALKFNTTGTSNVSVGQGALSANTIGSDNIAIGQSALLTNTTGGLNIAVGLNALNTNLTNNSSIGIGENSLYNQDDGFENIGIGNFSGDLIDSGTYNTSVGNKAGRLLQSGKFDTFLGYGAMAGTGYSDINNSTCIGANCVVSASNSIVLGASSVTAIGIGTSTPAYKLDVAGGDIRGRSAILFATSLTGTNTNSIGWVIVDQTDNQACNTGCTNACVFGIENATGTAVTNLVSCDGTTADLCACAGPS